MTRIFASVLAADYMRLGEEIESVEQAGIDGIHIDVMDGHFVENIAFGCQFSKAIRLRTKADLNVHLMVQNPERFVERYAEIGINMIFVHLEACKDIRGIAKAVKEKGCKIGLAINLDTPVVLVSDLTDCIDAVLILSVPVGIGGQCYDSKASEKISEMRKINIEKKADFEIFVDGGVNIENIGQIKHAGADCAIVGTALFNSKDYRKTIINIRDALTKTSK